MLDLKLKPKEIYGIHERDDALLLIDRGNQSMIIFFKQIHFSSESSLKMQNVLFIHKQYISCTIIIRRR